MKAKKSFENNDSKNKLLTPAEFEKLSRDD